MENQQTAVTTNETKAVAVANQSYISRMLEERRQGFMEANAGMDLDYVRMGEWLKLNKKGNFVEKDDESVSYGQTIDVVVGHGEQRWTLWGKDNTPEKGELITAEKTQEEAIEALRNWLAENPEAASRYTEDDIKLRYNALVVPVQTLTGEEGPKIYLMSFAPGDTIAWGKFAMKVYDGKFKALNIPKGTGINRVVVRLDSEERKNADNESYLGLTFQPVGLFNPADYGITE